MKGIRKMENKNCPNCNIEMTEQSKDLWFNDGSYWDKCPKCGYVDD